MSIATTKKFGFFTTILVLLLSSGAADQPSISSLSTSTLLRKPDGTSVTQTATTGSSGMTSFNTSGGRGTYTLTVSNLARTGYTFDAANRVLTKSITK